MTSITTIPETQMSQYKETPSEAPKGLFVTKHKKGGFTCLKNFMGANPEFSKWQFWMAAKGWLKNH